MKIKEFEEIGEDIISLNDPMFPLYIIRGDQPVLIDSGVSRKATLFQQRIRHVLGEQKLAFIILTHSHWDHTGALSYLAEVHQATVAASPEATLLLRKENVIAFINRLNREFASVEERDALPEVHSPLPLVSISDGERLQLSSDRALTALASPGHTRCSQSYMLEPDGVLFPGDAAGIMERNGEIRPLFLSNCDDYQNSLQKLSRLSANTLAFSHNHFIQGKESVSRYFEKSLETTNKWFTQIKERLQEGLDEHLIAERFVESAFSSTTLQSPKEVFIINMLAMIRAVGKTLN